MFAWFETVYHQLVFLTVVPAVFIALFLSLLYRYGFVSFSSREAVANVLRQGTIYYKGRKITVAPAIKKQVGKLPSILIFLRFWHSIDTTFEGNVMIVPC